ncbi:hypothetical protein OIE63_39135 [Streptomyces sp. NBC_01795]|uniref:hypothetical protein n=1 Tax=Streptomyces sp. NBC_01795 TaxID=2975943 RepID=UPI002DD848DB|nr:hypothetical protein [Streptomyces sp. NBC_01795]WSA90098.1 hypothetical protein OIE63_00025 [Streptomyces sp. NBC_01795]WSA96900.1 hypothetical protein OIE63_39135 [Streptomyces sp. NBC_01795]
MTRGLLHIDGAACWLREGDAARACSTATTALAEFLSGWRKGLTHTRAADLYRSIPARNRQESAARDLRQALARA